MTREEIISRQWEEATISNNFLFGKTMGAYPDLSKIGENTPASKRSVGGG